MEPDVVTVTPTAAFHWTVKTGPLTVETKTTFQKNQIFNVKHISMHAEGQLRRCVGIANRVESHVY